MNNTQLHLCRAKGTEPDTYLQLHYDDDGVMTYETIFFMDQNQLAFYLTESVDVENDIYGGGDRGEELSIATNVCYLPNSGETFITKDDYYLLDRFDMLEKAAELVRSVTAE